MGRHEGAQKQLQLLYLGSSATLGALRRSMEAHGMVTRTRLTPAVDAVIADLSVRADHPSVRAAHSLDIPVLRPDEAIEQLVDWRVRPAPIRPDTETSRPSWLFRPSTR